MSGFRVVLPAVEINLGTVAFTHDGDWHSFWVAEPTALLSALANSVRPSHWHPEDSTLTVTVAKTGHRAGEARNFLLRAQAHAPITVSDGVPCSPKAPKVAPDPASVSLMTFG